MLFVALILLILLDMVVYATYALFTSQYPSANDFYARWVGGCALLREGLNPYTDEITLCIQIGMRGRPSLPNEDQVAFAYPLFSLLFFFPLCATQDFALVQAVWFWLLLISLVASAILWMKVIRWRPPPRSWALTVLWVVLNYYSFRALILGQFAVLILLLLVAAFWAMKRRHDGWAGILLALTMVKPQMIYLTVPWILLWAVGQRRWRLLAGFFAAVVALAIGSMLLLPSWLPDFVRQVIAYPSYTVFGSLTWIVVQHWLGLGRIVEIAAMVVLGIAIVWLGGRLWRGTWEHMLWMAGLLLLVTNFFTPRIATTNYVLLIPWLLWGFCHMQRVWPRWGGRLVLAAQVVLLLAPWALFLATVQGNFEQPPVYIPFPATVALTLVWLWIQIKPASRITSQ